MQDIIAMSKKELHRVEMIQRIIPDSLLKYDLLTMVTYNFIRYHLTQNQLFEIKRYFWSII